MILYLEKERSVVQGSNVSLRQYIDTLDAQIQKKQAELVEIQRRQQEL